VILMSKKNKILLGVLLLVYVIALVVFHVTYDYTAYWDEESSLLMRYSFIYIVIGLVLYLVFNWKTIKPLITNMTLKRMTKIVAYASALKAVLCLISFPFGGHSLLIPLIQTAAWIAISVFFFTLHKNMQ